MASSRDAVALAARFGYLSLDVAADVGAVGHAAAARVQDGTIVMLQSNLGFLPFLRNTVCSLQRLQVHNWMTIALDNATCPGLDETLGDASERRVACVYPYRTQTEQQGRSSTFVGGMVKYGTNAFIRMVMQKPLWTKWLVDHGYSVLQCDLDIVWLHDPQPLLRSLLVAPAPPGVSVRAHPIAQPSARSPRVMARVAIPHSAHDSHWWSYNASRPPVIPDILFQSEQVHGINSGFYFARPTKATARFLAAWLKRLESQALNASTRGIDEQHAFNSALLRLKMAPDFDIAYGNLEDDQFPNGKIWWQYPMWADKRAAYIVHANWNTAMLKKFRLVRDGLWFLNKGDTQCSTGFDPFAGGCSKLCVPVKGTRPGQNDTQLRECQSLNREDNRRARKYGSKWSSSGKWVELAGRFWHPEAYRAIPGCSRNTSVATPYAEIIHRKLGYDLLTQVQSPARAAS